MTRRHPVNTRQSRERFTWLSVSKECRKRGYYPDTDAYDEKGLPRESACPALYRTVVSIEHTLCHYLVTTPYLDPNEI
ncbi:unnamed protein product [Aureobasidium pullulans]|nr:unnamed protein product [Aureobasidium pullulans]CAD0043449.1 unnamed protein product [Aureobasidium pullulans]